MSYYNLPFSAQILLNSCHLFDEVALFWAGGQACLSGSNAVPNGVTLGVLPSQSVIFYTQDEVQAWVAGGCKPQPQGDADSLVQMPNAGGCKPPLRKGTNDLMRIPDAGGNTPPPWDNAVLPKHRRGELYSPVSNSDAHEVRWAGLRSGWAGYFAYAATEGQPLAVFYEFPLTIGLDLARDICWVNNPRGLNEAQVAAFVAQVEWVIGRRGELYSPDANGDEAPLRNNESPLVQMSDAGGYKPPLQSDADTTQKCRGELYSPAQQPIASAWSPRWSQEQYQQAFAKVMAYLRAGDCYQVNLAMPFDCQEDLTERSPLPLLRSFNPSFGGYFKSAAQTLFSVSPERFISVAGDRLETRPIKGTVARGRTAEEDEANKEWLSHSAKNQAENLMIVDLLRNDLSLFAKPFSVKVDKLFALETHANVHHLVSTISAQLRPEASAMQALYAAFPGGSITGAPKKRAMEIIEELEAEPRGAYCGSFGYIDDSGHADFNILIRTVVAQKDGARCWAGGGLVMDSQCGEEWAELHTKVARILAEF